MNEQTCDNTRAAAEAEIIKALAHPVRLRVTRLLDRNGPMCVCRLNESFDLDQSTLSRHLQQMKRAGLISDRKEGTMTIYSLAVPCVLGFLSCVDRVLKARIEAQRLELDRLAGREG